MRATMTLVADGVGGVADGGRVACRDGDGYALRLVEPQVRTMTAGSWTSTSFSSRFAPP